jgi:hypothetical protein
MLTSPLFANPHLATRIMAGAAGVFIPAAISVFWLGMMSGCLSSRKLTARPKTACLLLMAVTNVIGVLIYYFAQYQKQRMHTAEI